MSENLITQELGIIVAAKNHRPTLLNVDFLKYSDIVPNEWELARQPIHTQSISQVVFTNGIVIVAEATKVIFIESIQYKNTAEITIAEIAKKYVQTLPNVEYEAVGINPRSYITFDQQPDSAHQYITNKLLSRGAWQEVGNAPVSVTLNLAYTLERCPFYLTVSEALLQNSDRTNTPIVLFNGSFSYEVISKTASERLVKLHKIINNWRLDLVDYQEILRDKFLNQNVDNTTMFSLSNAKI